MLMRRPLLPIGLLMLLPLIWLALLGWPAPDRPATTELVRLRNALLIESSQPENFQWLPKQRPDSFLVDQGPLPQPMQQWLEQLPQQANDWQQILTLTEHLRAKGPSGGALQTNTLESFERIISDGKGYCADYIQVINALAQGAGIPVREWGMSFDGFGGWGHAFSEFYSQHLNKWVFVDVFNGFYASTLNNDTPLSVLELRQQLADAPQQLQLHRLRQGRFGMRTDQVAIDYYRRGEDQFYLWWGTNALSFDRHPVIAAAGKLSRSLEQLTALVLNLHPSIRIVELPQNRSTIAYMLNLKYQLLVIVTLELLLALTAILCWRKTRHSLTPERSL